jgi:Flp pilus assembly protein TadG
LRKKWIAKRKDESGQALVEFVFILPLFMLILMGIMDFGWLFYNYIGVENCARNGARIACVEYIETNYIDNKTVPVAKTFDPNFVDTEDYYRDEEVDIVKATISAKPSSVSIQNIKVSYSVDEEYAGNMVDYYAADLNDPKKLSGTLRRANGNVTVTVQGRMKVLTPVLGVFSDHGYLNLKSSSVYQVERRSDSEPPDD